MDGQIEEVTLSLSGITVQWRPDNLTYRLVPEPDIEPEWMQWLGRVERVAVRMGGDIWARPGWCVLVGESPPERLNNKPVVRLADGSEIGATRLGRLWIAEWIGNGKPVTIGFGRAEVELYAFINQRPVIS